MNERLRSLLFSLAITLVGALLLHVHLERQRERVAGGPQRAVVAVTSDLEAGRALRSDMLTTRTLPSAYLESRHILERDLVDIVGSTLAIPVRAGESLLWTDLSSIRSATRKLSTLVPHGMRALSLHLRAGAFDDLLSPGDRVDVLLVRGGSQVVDDVAQNLLVLAVGRDLGGQQAPARRGGGRVALALTLDQSRRVVQAERHGQLRLLLRRPDDLALSHGPDELPGEP